MTTTLVPSTQWTEQPAADEGERYADYARRFAIIQARKSAKYGVGRTLHRKQVCAAQGTLEVLPDVPSFAWHGLFAVPAKYEVLLRLSNGGMDRARDRTPDIRGLALRVLGVKGESALGNGPAKSQDFTLINQEAFAFAGSAEFVDFVEAASRGNGALLKFLLRRYGWMGGPRQLLRMLGIATKSFGGFATEPVFSVLPMACGPYAVRVRLVPALSNGVAAANARQDWGADFSARLKRHALQWDLQLQPYLSEALTPIEDASVNWSSPYSTVARLVLPQQDSASAKGQALARQVEADVFDPWHALADHRPLGDVQRARKVVYFESQKGRGAA
ncbi:catalase [Rhodoferax sp.]|uniref:catalase n=1 Tax=Rhodoferax sp. TaxID=50421 RepID=UPI0027669A2D|nr:catalase [Rhodoferax sp.]